MPSVNDFISERAAEARIERLTSMIEYAESSLEQGIDLIDRMESLRQMLSGERKHQMDSLALSAYRKRSI